ncbi:hypothetical protein HORIV_33740 [Vreelandella olivaria]|uniref:Uncharacterized protein n=1 Tax=Vreelandella olivaria TaxID=390919 RepID=A0ABM7GJW4_9GAMM|nr:hypothetical protein HORIV_33740 [Halomonas olivaria]
MSLMDALPTPRLRWEGRHPNIVLITLSLTMLAAFWLLDVVSMAPIASWQGRVTVRLMRSVGPVRFW